MPDRDSLTRTCFAAMAVLLFGHCVLYADCSTYLYGGANGNPSDTGVYGHWYSNAYRLNGNEVVMYSNTGVDGPNAGLVLTHVITYYYRNGGLIRWDRGNSLVYGSTITQTTRQSLYWNGQYYLGLLQLGNPNGNRNDHWGTSPVCGVTADDDKYIVHYYDYSNVYTAFKPTIQVTGDTTGATQWAFWYLGGSPSIDGYYVKLALTGHTNWGTDTNPITWNAVLGGDKININPNTGAQTLVTSLVASPAGSSTYDVAVRISTDGLPSDAFPLYINTPRSATSAVIGSGNLPPNGYYVDMAYTPHDNLGYTLAPITMHETFENRKEDWAGTDWQTPTSSSGAPADWDRLNNRFIDRLGAYGNANPAAANYNAAGTTSIMNFTQKWWLGTVNNPQNVNTFTGSCIRKNKTQYYQDNVALTVQQSPADNAACAAGKFAN